VNLCEYNPATLKCTRCGHVAARLPTYRHCLLIGGPGTELKKLLAGWPFYITASPDCSCNRVAAEMDAWGPDECEKPERQDYILAAMRENAEKRGLPFLDAAGRFLIKRAIHNARKAFA